MLTGHAAADGCEALELIIIAQHPCLLCAGQIVKAVAWFRLVPSCSPRRCFWGVRASIAVQGEADQGAVANAVLAVQSYQCGDVQIIQSGCAAQDDRQRADATCAFFKCYHPLLFPVAKRGGGAFVTAAELTRSIQGQAAQLRGSVGYLGFCHKTSLLGPARMYRINRKAGWRVCLRSHCITPNSGCDDVVSLIAGRSRPAMFSMQCAVLRQLCTTAALSSPWAKTL